MPSRLILVLTLSILVLSGCSNEQKTKLVDVPKEPIAEARVVGAPQVDGELQASERQSFGWAALRPMPS